MRFLTLALVIAGLCAASTTSYARKMVAPGGQNCEMVETATIGINFNNIPTDIRSAKSYAQEKADEVLAMAGDLGIQDIVVQNMNYNIYANNGGGCSNANTPHMLNGGVSFQIGDAAKAADLMDAISDKGYSINFNMNAYRQCN